MGITTCPACKNLSRISNRVEKTQPGAWRFVNISSRLNRLFHINSTENRSDALPRCGSRSDDVVRLAADTKGQAQRLCDQVLGHPLPEFAGDVLLGAGELFYTDSRPVDDFNFIGR